MNAFVFVGGAAALWALLVAFMGITREGFPATQGAERAVTAISVLITLAAIGTAIVVTANENHDEGGKSESAAFVR